MQSKRWRGHRERALEYHGRKCSVCGTTYDLQVHHLTYVRLGREKMKDLRILCKGCHANEHEGKVPGVFDPMTREFMAICG